MSRQRARDQHSRTENPSATGPSEVERRLVHGHPLTRTVDALRTDRWSLERFLSCVASRVAATEPIVRALLPERGRIERLRRAADALTGRWPDPAARPPLYGALLGVKDIFHVDGFVTRAGTEVPPESFAGDEGPVVRALRDAGALVFAKTVTTEFAFYEPGPTRNPHAPRHTPGGSSSGSAAAVAAGLCPLALGTQTVGSVIRPAAYCGIVGVKPSFGRISTAGIVPFSASADHVGWFTQDVAGARRVASVLLNEPDPGPSSSHPTLGVPEGPFLKQASPTALSALAAQLDRLSDAGYRIRRISTLADIEAINRRHRQLIAAEMAAAHAPWLEAHTDRYRPRTLALVREGQAVTPDDLAAARRSRTALRAELQAAATSAGIDAWLSPAAPGPAPSGIESTGDPIMNLPWTHAGLPAITVPAGHASNDLPLGLQLTANHGADLPLLSWAEPLATAVTR